ncbi:MAG TPA: hypothetical protein VER17_11915 [Tepidisphaeraceae bacterium]|nr:hypothetical protein [Tepidisphaeraceae bacterium]
MLCVFYVTGYAAAMGLRAPAANAYYFYYDVRSVMLDAALYYGFYPLYALHGASGLPGFVHHLREQESPDVRNSGV